MRVVLAGLFVFAGLFVGVALVASLGLENRPFLTGIATLFWFFGLLIAALWLGRF